MIKTLQTIIIVATVIHRFVIIYQNLREDENKPTVKDITPQTNRRT